MIEAPIRRGPYQPDLDGRPEPKHGLCSRTWCAKPAISTWITRGGQFRHDCADHLPPAEPAPPGEQRTAAGSGDGRYHAAGYLKKYGG